MKSTAIIFIALSITSLQLYSQQPQEIESIRSEMIREMTTYHFARHLLSHFSRPTIEHFIRNAEKKTGLDFERFDKNLAKSERNFHTSQSFPQSSPAGKTLEKYLKALKNQKP